MAAGPSSKMSRCPSCGANNLPSDPYCWICKGSLYFGGASVSVPAPPPPSEPKVAVRLKLPNAGLPAKAPPKARPQAPLLNSSDNTASSDLKLVLAGAVICFALILLGSGPNGGGVLVSSIIFVPLMIGLLIAILLAVDNEKTARRSGTPRGALGRVGTVIGYLLLAVACGVGALFFVCSAGLMGAGILFGNK